MTHRPGVRQRLPGAVRKTSEATRTHPAPARASGFKAYAYYGYGRAAYCREAACADGSDAPCPRAIDFPEGLIRLPPAPIDDPEAKS